MVWLSARSLVVDLILVEDSFGMVVARLSRFRGFYRGLVVKAILDFCAAFRQPADSALPPEHSVCFTRLAFTEKT